jgi:hypothetical protein
VVSILPGHLLLGESLSMNFDDLIEEDKEKKVRAHPKLNRSTKKLKKVVDRPLNGRSTSDIVETRRKKQAALPKTSTVEDVEIMPDLKVSVYKPIIKKEPSIVPTETDDEFIAVPLSERSPRHSKLAERVPETTLEDRQRSRESLKSLILENLENEEYDDESTAVEEEEPTKDIKKKKPLGRPPKTILPGDLGEEDSRSARKKSQRLLEEAEDAEFSTTVQNSLTAFSGEVVVKSIFKEKANDIMEMLEVGNQDGALTLTMKTLMHTLLVVLPLVEGAVQKSGGTKGVYQLTQVTSQVREMCADIQAYRDKANLGQQLVDRFIRPAVIDIGTQIMQAWVELESEAQRRMSKEDYEEFKDRYTLVTRRGLSSFITRKYEEMAKQLVQSLT